LLLVFNILRALAIVNGKRQFNFRFAIESANARPGIDASQIDSDVQAFECTELTWTLRSSPLSLLFPQYSSGIGM
jgi:hypothetical protein